MPLTILFEGGPLQPQFLVVDSYQSNQPKQTQLGCGSLKHRGAPLLLWQGLANCIVGSAQEGKGPLAGRPYKSVSALAG
jgi:hypothetical protein